MWIYVGYTFRCRKLSLHAAPWKLHSPSLRQTSAFQVSYLIIDPCHSPYCHGSPDVRPALNAQAHCPHPMSASSCNDHIAHACHCPPLFPVRVWGHTSKVLSIVVFHHGWQVIFIWEITPRLSGFVRDIEANQWIHLLHVTFMTYILFFSWHTCVFMT